MLLLSSKFITKINKFNSYILVLLIYSSQTNTSVHRIPVKMEDRVQMELTVTLALVNKDSAESNAKQVCFCNSPFHGS